AVPADKVQILVDYVLKGQQWMGRWRYTVPSTLDRAVSRPNTFDIGDLDGNAALLAELSPKDRPALEEVRARLARRAPTLTGFRAFPYSDFACYQRPEFSFFVKTISTRTQPTESGMNGENVKGALLNSGDTYVLREGDEYDNLAPVWDWTLLPGVTSVAGLSKVDRQEFVGAVSDGDSGCVAMDYAASDPHGSGKFHVRKAYFCHGDAVVCLIGDLAVQAGDSPAQTALDQRLLRGPVIAADGSGQTRTLSIGETRLLGARWIYHDGLVYVPTTPSNLTVRLGPVTGTWRAINASGSTNPVEKPVFLPFHVYGGTLEHGADGYAIARCSNFSQAAEYAQAPGYNLLRNDAQCQAIQWKDGVIMAAFYSAGDLRTGEHVSVSVDQPCLVLICLKGTFASDPTRQGKTVCLTTNGRTSTLTLPKDGTSVKASEGIAGPPAAN
ncbi:MAG: chondroitin AC lyase, partial [Rhodospirillales bacterium]|nr:chondroitin AC lyase [Acetobacter sp.]